MDENGYPTEEELFGISDYRVTHENLHEFMDYVKPLWHWQNMFQRRVFGYVLITGGWSGNEDIIRAMKQNTFFWMLYWQSSTRGGTHVFCKPSIESESE